MTGLAVALFQVFLDGTNRPLQFLHFTAQIIRAIFVVVVLMFAVRVLALLSLIMMLTIDMGRQFLRPIVQTGGLQMFNGRLNVTHSLFNVAAFAMFAFDMLVVLGDFAPDQLLQFRRRLFFAGLAQLGNLPFLLLHPALQLVAAILAGFVALFTAFSGGAFVSLENLLRLGGQRLRPVELALFTQCIYFRLALLQPSLYFTMLAIPLAVAFTTRFIATWLIAVAVPFAVAFSTGLVALTIAAWFIAVAVAFPILVAIGPVLGKHQQAGGQPGKQDA